MRVLRQREIEQERRDGDDTKLRAQARYAVDTGDALRRNGPAAVCIGRMMPGLRTGISIPAGLIAMPRPVFYGWTAVGTTIWTGGLTLAGYLLEEKFKLVEDWAGPIGLGIMACVFGIIGWKIWRARQRG